MFTGLVQAVGSIGSRRERGHLLELVIESDALSTEIEVGASIAVSGVCLTATERTDRWFRVDVAAETRRRTRLGRLLEGSRVNLELPLRPADRLGGHFVQGHIDEVGRVLEAGSSKGDMLLRVAHEPEASRLVVEKGSIALDGVSLTVTRRGRGWLEVMLIPHTLAVTTLGSLAPGHEVHVEYDILAKYVIHLTRAYRASEGPEKGKQ